MINGLIKSWNAFRGTVRGFDSSRQLALGVSLGMIVGLVPKESLFPYAVAVLLLLSTANLLTGAISAFFFSWAGLFCDSISHRIGNLVLTFDLFEPTFAKLNQIPLIPWTRFENTVVSGSLILGLLLAYPIYRISLALFERYGAHFSALLHQSRIGKWMLALPPETEVA